jgi:hypothetical protein
LVAIVEANPDTTSDQSIADLRRGLEDGGALLIGAIDRDDRHLHGSQQGRQA